MYIDKVSSGATRVVFQEIVVPRVTNRMFCASSTLSVKVKTQACGWKAPRGHSWAYDFNSGGRIAAVCEAKCPRRETVYKLQTFTPGLKILRQSGVAAVAVYDGLLV